MGCEDYRELLSARLDGEEEGGEGAALDAHLTGCGACRAWYDAAARVTRLARMAPAQAGPDLVEAVLAQVPKPGRSPGLALRWALGAVGAAEMAIGVSSLLFPHGEAASAHHGEVLGAAIGHLSHESAAWSLALGVAFCWAAWRVRNLAGLVPVLATFTLVILGISLIDLAQGRVDEVRVISHLLTLMGLVLVVRLTHAYPPQPTQADGDQDVPRPKASDAVGPPPRLRSITGHIASHLGRRAA